MKTQKRFFVDGGLGSLQANTLDQAKKLASGCVPMANMMDEYVPLFPQGSSPYALCKTTTGRITIYDRHLDRTYTYSQKTGECIETETSLWNRSAEGRRRTKMIQEAGRAIRSQRGQ